MKKQQVIHQSDIRKWYPALNWSVMCTHIAGPFLRSGANP